MQGLMSSYPLTLTHLFERAERLFGEKTLTTLTATGKDRTTYAVGEKPNERWNRREK